MAHTKIHRWCYDLPKYFDSFLEFDSSYSLTDAIEFFIRYPQTEIFFSTYKTLLPFHFITPQSGTKPSQIIGISKPVLSAVMNLNRKTFSSPNLRAIQEIDAFFKDKPDFTRNIIVLYDLLEGKVSFPTLAKLFVEEKYDISKLRKYLTDDVYTYQGISSPGEACIILSDYISLCKRMEVPYERFPKSLKLAHDIAVKNVTIIVNEMERKAFLEVVNKADYKSLEYEGKKYSVVLPSSADDIVSEGRRLHHCVGSYVNKIKNNETKIVFMRDNKTIDVPLITLEVRDGKLTQYRGSCNRQPFANEMEFIREYAEHLDIPIV